MAFSIKTREEKKAKIDFGLVAPALMQDLRPQNAARLAMTNRQRVYRLIDKLSIALKPAHQMWKRRFS